MSLKSSDYVQGRQGQVSICTQNCYDLSRIASFRKAGFIKREGKGFKFLAYSSYDGDYGGKTKRIRREERGVPFNTAVGGVRAQPERLNTVTSRPSIKLALEENTAETREKANKDERRSLSAY